MIDPLRRLSPAVRLRVALAIGLVLVIGCAALVYGRIAPTSVGAGEFSRSERQAVEQIVRAYILEHPEIIPEAINHLQDREVTKMLGSNRAAIETPFGSAWAGAKDGDVTLVEFFDYNCPYCRVSHPDVQRLLREDSKLRVVYRDFPVLGPASEEAALASLSAAKQGRYVAFYNRSFEAPGRPNHERTIQMVRAAGLNEQQTASDMNSAGMKNEIKKNLELGRALGLTGTPSYVVGDKILSGAVGYDELKKAVAAARNR